MKQQGPRNFHHSDFQILMTSTTIFVYEDLFMKEKQSIPIFISRLKNNNILYIKIYLIMRECAILKKYYDKISHQIL